MKKAKLTKVSLPGVLKFKDGTPFDIETSAIATDRIVVKIDDSESSEAADCYSGQESKVVTINFLLGGKSQTVTLGGVVVTGRNGRYEIDLKLGNLKRLFAYVQELPILLADRIVA